MGRKTKWGGVFFCIVIISLFLAENFSEQQRVPYELFSWDRSLSHSNVMVEPDDSGNTGSIRPESDGGERQSAEEHRSEPSRLSPPEQNKSFVEDEILVQFAPKMNRDEIVNLLDVLGMSIEQVLNSNNLCRIKLPESLNVDDALRIFKEVPDIQFSEPNYIVRTTAVPSDDSYDNQWGLNNTGSRGGTVDADIDAPEAWDTVTGSSSVIVAVVDEGVDIHHDDLSGNIWTNTAEISGNGIDDDGNGYIDDMNGWDFNHNDATVYDAANEDRHGTQVSGIIGATGNNGIGVAGICWTVRIMPVKFISSGSGTVSNAILALNYAVANGAKVINCSWGGTSYSASLEGAFRNARDAGVLVVTSAGNSGKDTDSSSHYPSNYDLANLLSVAATDRNDELAYFSNYGLTTVDLGAPGYSVYTTSPEQKYANFSGTSAAAPFVSGAAALALSLDPNLTYLQLKDQILNSVDPLTELTETTVTGGRLNLHNIITALNNIDADEDGLPSSYEVQFGLNPNDPSDAGQDQDGDGLTNLQEYDNGTDPTNPDSDGDGLPDGYEISLLLDPTSDEDGTLDLDEDGLSNLKEYEVGTSLNEIDTDGDGIDDFTEFGPLETAADSDGDTIIDALDTDSDNDGKPDAEEGVGDDDDDGIANYCDMNDTDGPEGDQDGDGLTNSVEATYLLFPNRIDSDVDGIDDLTEFGSSETPRDSDGDELIDALDLDADNDGTPDSVEGTGDLDGDGIPNYRDRNDSDGALGDTDGDGLINQIESLYGLNVNLADSDSDDIDDATEFGAGATPLDSDGDGLIDALDTDSDNDGAPDETEEQNDTDGDGTPDRLDEDSATMRTGYGNLSLLVSGERGGLKDVTFLSQAASESAYSEYDFRYGGVQYQITGLDSGESVQVTIQSSSSEFPSNTEFWKYDEEAGYTVFPASISGNKLVFTLTDGGDGDDDGLANGTIVDPAYIVVPVQSADTSAPPPSSGGGGGCSLSSKDVPLNDSWLNLVILLLPVGVLFTLRIMALRLYPRARS